LHSCLENVNDNDNKVFMFVKFTKAIASCSIFVNDDCSIKHVSFFIFSQITQFLRNFALMISNAQTFNLWDEIVSQFSTLEVDVTFKMRIALLGHISISKNR
jgi:CRISPR/Cas system endoribonuclease Cas6 (RAMP superfamily)